MAPPPCSELVVLRLTFSPHEHPKSPRIYMHRRKHPPNATTPLIREWIARIVSNEKSNVPPNRSVNYCEWIISTSDVTLFILNGCRFENFLLILGDQVAHWVFYNHMPQQQLRVEGSASLPVNYCSCCLGSQYLNIMEAVKGCVSQRDDYYRTEDGIS